MELLNKINTFSENNGLIAPRQTIIVGFSGGPDSTLLLHWLASITPSYHLQLVAAHLNHGWRVEADAEEEFCRQQAEKLGISLQRDKLQNFLPQLKFNGSQEEMARRGRRLFFESIADQFPGSLIALGHHQDDQLETFFIRLIRGSSLSGLTGIQPKNDRYIRPLLCVSKKEIAEYLESHKIPFVIDASNESDSFLRNRIRNQIVPAFDAVDSRFQKNFHASVEQLQETEKFLQEYTQTLFETISKQCDDTIALDRERVINLHPVIQKRIFILWLCASQVLFVPSTAFFNEMSRFITNNKSSSHALHSSWKVVKKGTYLFIEKI
jgi:tRNA(Ile)-lysidine synthase